MQTQVSTQLPIEELAQLLRQKRHMTLKTVNPNTMGDGRFLYRVQTMPMFPADEQAAAEVWALLPEGWESGAGGKSIILNASREAGRAHKANWTGPKLIGPVRCFFYLAWAADRSQAPADELSSATKPPVFEVVVDRNKIDTVDLSVYRVRPAGSIKVARVKSKEYGCVFTQFGDENCELFKRRANTHPLKAVESIIQTLLMDEALETGAPGQVPTISLVYR